MAAGAIFQMSPTDFAHWLGDHDCVSPQAIRYVKSNGIVPWAVLQPLPLLVADEPGGAALMGELRAALASLVGVRAAPVSAAPAAPRPSGATATSRRTNLLPAAALANVRLRVSLTNATPHFCGAPGAVLCNRCGDAMPIDTDDALARSVFGAVWREYRWKTFLCEPCAAYAVEHTLVASGDNWHGARCHGCFAADATRGVPLRYAIAADATVPRHLPLCEACRHRHNAQVATVDYRPAAADDGARSTL